MSEYKVTLQANGYVYAADKPYIEALRQIIEACYNHSFGQTVSEHLSVKIATKTLCDHGFVVVIERNVDGKGVHG